MMTFKLNTDNNKKSQDVSDLHDQESTYHITYLCMNDDVWVTCFCFLNVQDLLSIHKSCTNFHRITDNTRYPIINKLWKYHCRQLCINIDKHNDTDDDDNDFTTDDWKLFYRAMINFLVKHQFINDDLKHDYINHDKSHMLLGFGSSYSNPGPALNLTTNDDCNPIKLAIQDDDVLMFRLLTCDISNMNNPLPENCVDFPLLLAARYDSVQVASYMLETYSDVKVSDYSTFEKRCIDTPLIVAVRSGNIGMVTLLLTHKNMTQEMINFANYNQLNRCALFYACKNWGNNKHGKQIVELFLDDERTDINKADFEGVTPFMLAEEHQDRNISNLFTKKRKTMTTVN